MAEIQSNKSAKFVALVRASHQLLDSPLVLDDPISLKIIGEETLAWMKNNLEAWRGDGNIRAAIVARSRFAEDNLEKALIAGIQQYVIMGAGLDTFAYRNSYSRQNLQIFEIDHPDIQAWKQKRLAIENIPIPQNLTFVPIDFTKKNLGGGLHEANFNSKVTTFFSLLGVAIYLEKSEIFNILQYVATLPKGCGIVFDYGILDEFLSESLLTERQAAAKVSAAAGEPFKTFLDPDELEQSLHDMGYKEVENMDASVINKKYFSNRNDGFEVKDSGRRLICALT